MRIRTLSLTLLLTTLAPLAAATPSAALRDEQHIYVAYALGVAGAEARAGLYLPLDTTIDVGSGARASPFLDGHWETLYLLRARKFIGNSFYAMAGMGQGHFGSDSDANEFKGLETRSVEGGLGNEWILGHFVLGCEWLGFERIRFASNDSYVRQHDGHHYIKDGYATQTRLLTLTAGLSF